MSIDYRVESKVKIKRRNYGREKQKNKEVLKR